MHLCAAALVFGSWQPPGEVAERTQGRVPAALRLQPAGGAADSSSPGQALRTQRPAPLPPQFFTRPPAAACGRAAALTGY